MINFVFDTWETSAPSENQRTSIFTSYFFPTWPTSLAYGWQKYVGPTQFSDVGPTLAKWRRANVVVPTATMATLRQRSCAIWDMTYLCICSGEGTDQQHTFVFITFIITTIRPAGGFPQVTRRLAAKVNWPPNLEVNWPPNWSPRCIMFYFIILIL